MSENERIKELRKSLNLTQEEFSEILGIQRASYSDIERGKVGVSSLVLKNLVEKFHINPLWFYSGHGNMYLKDNNVEESDTTFNELMKEELERQDTHLQALLEQYESMLNSLTQENLELKKQIAKLNSQNTQPKSNK